MDMSRAALPPIQPTVTAQDRGHSRFAEYQSYRASMGRLLVEASAFKDWLYQTERHDQNASVERHPRFREFQQWMRVNQGGARGGLAFPENFFAWLDGKRW